MEKQQFKTNINCGSCIKKVSVFLDEVENIQWKVDTNNPDKILTVESTSVKKEEIIEAVESAGFDIEEV